jgi:CheY-like chemotaxis protein
MKGEIKHICLAEDDPDDHYLFYKVLHETNSAVKLTWFQTCEDLLTYLETGSDLPELIVLDMNMPKMNGQTCLTTIKNELRLYHIPVVILSTTDHPDTISLAYQAGAFKYYQKPSSLDVFKQIIREILDTPFTGN